jgi:HEAT repeat protein
MFQGNCPKCGQTVVHIVGRGETTAREESILNAAEGRTVEQLITSLKDDAWYVRWEVVQALGKLGDARAVEPLFTALKDVQQHVRLEATQALGKLGDARAVEPLIAVLKDEMSTDVRRSAIKALGKLGDARAVEPLIDILKDGQQHVRLELTQALGRLDDARDVEPLIDVIKDEISNIKALEKLGDSMAVELLNIMLEHNEVIEWREARKALEALGWKPDKDDNVI